MVRRYPISLLFTLIGNGISLLSTARPFPGARVGRRSYPLHLLSYSDLPVSWLILNYFGHWLGQFTDSSAPPPLPSDHQSTAMYSYL